MARPKQSAQYLEYLENGYSQMRDHGPVYRPGSRLEYLTDYIFDFIAYDSDISKLFARKAVEVCAAITNRETYEYIADESNYVWYLMMCNMAFFRERISWGSSIRGVWWGAGVHEDVIKFSTCGLYDGHRQMTEAMEFTLEEWTLFIRAIIEFAAPEMQPADDKFSPRLRGFGGENGQTETG